MVSWRGKNHFDSKKLQSIVTKYNGWYVSDDFNLLVKRELVRSTRSGLPVSQVLFELSNHHKNSGLITEEVYSNFLALLIESINDHSRISDVKILTDDQSKIAILLVDTSLEGAKAFIEKLLSKFFIRIQTQLHLGYVNPINSITVSVYPFNAIKKLNQINGTPLVVNNLELAGNANGYANHNGGEQPYGYTNGHITAIAEKTYEKQVESQAIANSADLREMKSPIILDALPKSLSQRIYLFLKRLLDIIGALAGIILSLPFFLIIPVAIKLTSKGPVLFKQERIGYGAKPFTFLKFRTMKTDSGDQIHKDYVRKHIEGKTEEINNGDAEKPLYKINNDPRITKVGHILRKTSLDELPQFFNVLIGDMSLVGPRPPIPYEVEFYKNWHLRRVMEVKPGITGLWQVYGRNKTTFDNMVRLDLQYVRKKSIFFDLKIIFKTVTVMLNTRAGL